MKRDMDLVRSILLQVEAARKAIAESVGSTTFDVIKQVCVSVAAKLAIAAIA